MEVVLPHIATITVALIAAFSAIATQRTASKATRKEEKEATRASMETEAYERARAFDTDTMNRQKQRISEQDDEIDELNAELDKLRDVNKNLRNKLEDCEDCPHDPDG